jgi:hypothetical protein
LIDKILLCFFHQVLMVKAPDAIQKNKCGSIAGNGSNDMVFLKRNGNTGIDRTRPILGTARNQKQHKYREQKREAM